MQEIEQDVLGTIRAHLEGRGIDGEKVTAEADLFSDLGMDSLDTVELTLALEERYSIRISDADLEDVSTVGDAVTLIQKKRSVTA
ncbi:MAG: acyl carrier protein [Actinomycetota bacterium]|nr:acyl carrier protein [Actinomycetota bacterium]